MSDDMFGDADTPVDVPTQIATAVCNSDAIRAVVTNADQLCAIHGAIQTEAAATLTRLAGEREEQARLLQRSLAAIRVLRTMLDNAGLAGSDIAADLVADIEVRQPQGQEP